MRQASCVLLWRHLRDRPAAWLAVRARRAVAYAGYLECPGGLMEPDETPAYAAASEVLEETGLHVHPDQLQVCGELRFSGRGLKTVACHLFMLQLFEGERPLQTEPTKRGAWSPLFVEDVLLGLHGGPISPATHALLLVARESLP